jgi:hypothetical protein
MPNPPKFDPARGARGRGPMQLPAEGRQGPPPAWPLEGRQYAAEKRAWEQLWSTPQAVAWERLGWTRTVARYCRTLVQAEHPGAPPALLAQVTAMEDRLGLTPKAMRLLLWEVVADEVADKRQPTSRARGRIRAV